MSSFEDVRKLFQDVVAPDLKAIAVRVDALEQTLNQRFEAAEKTNKAGFDHVEKVAALRYELLLARVESILAAMNMDRRIEQLESQIASKNKGLPDQEH